MTPQEQKEHLENLLNYIREDVVTSDIERAWDLIDRYRCPLQMADDNLYWHIQDLCEEFTYENDLEEDWFFEIPDVDGIEGIFELL